MNVAFSRPLWRGDGPAPEGYFALKLDFHRCEDYRNQLAKIELQQRSASDPSLLGGKDLGQFMADLEKLHSDWRQA